MSFRKFVTYLLLIVSSTILTIGTMFFLFITSIQLMVSSAKHSIQEGNKPLLSENRILVLNLDYPIKDKQDSPFASFDFNNFKFQRNLTLPQILQVIYTAGKDPKIKGFVLNTRGLSAGLATTEEIRNALKKTDKPVWAFSDIYTQKSYYLSSVADTVDLSPQGVFEWKGLAAQLTFYKDLLDRLGIRAQVIRHGKFKSAVEPFIRDNMSQANREQLGSMLHHIWNVFKSDIGQKRHLDPAVLDTIANNLEVKTTVDGELLGFFDHIRYDSQFREAFKKSLKLDDVSFVNEKDYYTRKIQSKNLFKNLQPGKKIGVILAEGEIVLGSGQKEKINSNDLIETIREVKNDDNIGSVVLRINSPGGSALASEDIWYELKLLAEKKPLIVSMGDLAASGGYYIATAGKYIFADRTTVTGSIGVFGLIPDVSGFVNDKLHIHIDTVKTNKHADMGVLRPLDQKEKEYLQSQVEYTYKTFLDHVAKARNMTVAEVDSVGQGRVWTGEQAVEIGLVDESGGLVDAIKTAGDMKEISFDRVKFYPTDNNPFAKLFRVSADGQTLISLFFPSLKPEIDQIRRIGKTLDKSERIQMRMPYNLKISD